MTLINNILANVKEGSKEMESDVLVVSLCTLVGGTLGKWYSWQVVLLAGGTLGRWYSR